MQKNDKESKASSIVERRGIYYPAFDIYSGVGGFYDYGPIGLRIKRNIENIIMKRATKNEEADL